MAEAKRIITLKASDGDDLEVAEAVAKVSGTIRRKIDADGGLVIWLPDISSVILTKVMEYCAKHAPAPAPASTAVSASEEDDDDAKNWDAAFIDVDETTLSDIILASDILEVKGLQVLSVRKKVLTLRTIDNEDFAVEASLAWRMKTVRNMLLRQPRCANGTIFLPNVNSIALSAVLEYYRKHEMAKKAGWSKAKINELDGEFIKLNVHVVFDMIRAATYLEARGLLNLIVNAAKAVEQLAQLTPVQIAKEVVEGRYTQEEEAVMLDALAKVI